jgi:hypothetical protein
MPATVFGLSPYLFVKEAHRLILVAGSRLLAQGETPDERLLADELRRTGELTTIGGEAYLGFLVAEATLPSQLPHYVGRLRDAAAQRTAARTGNALLRAIDSNGHSLGLTDLVAGSHSYTAELEQLRGDRPEALRDLAAQTLTWADLTAPVAVSRREHWPGWVPAGACCIISGAGDSLKSWLLLSLAVCTAAGRPLFAATEAGTEAIPLTQGPVVYVSGENAVDEEQRRCRLLKAGLGLPDELPNPLRFIPVSDFVLMNDEDYQALWAIVERTRPAMLGLDSAIALSGLEDENDNIAVRRFLKARILPFARDLGVTVYLTAHGPKPPTQPAMRLGDEHAIRGAGDWRNGVDVVVAARRDPALGEAAVVLRHAKNRLGRRAHPLWCQLRVEEPDGREAIAASLVAGGEYSEVGAGIQTAVRRALDAVVAALRDAPSGIFEVDLVKRAVAAAGTSAASCRRALAYLRGKQPWPVGPHKGRKAAVVTKELIDRRVFLTLDLARWPADDEWE